MIVISLASVIIGEVICGRRGIVIGIVSAVLGSVVHRIIIAPRAALQSDERELAPAGSGRSSSATLAVPAAPQRSVQAARKENRVC